MHLQAAAGPSGFQAQQQQPPPLNAVLVSRRQQGNPVLKIIRQVTLARVDLVVVEVPVVGMMAVMIGVGVGLGWRLASSGIGLASVDLGRIAPAHQHNTLVPWPPQCVWLKTEGCWPQQVPNARGSLS